MAPKKGESTKKSKTSKKAPGRPKKEAKTSASSPKSNHPIDPKEQALFLDDQHLPKYARLKAAIGTATGNFRAFLKDMKKDGFSKEDFETAIALQDAEKEAREAAKTARKMVIGTYVGSKKLGKQQLDLFLEPDRTPAVDGAYEEGKRASMQNQAARPGYDPSTPQHANYMKGFHDHQESLMKSGIKKTEPPAPTDSAKAEKGTDNPKAEAVPAEEVTSGVALTRAQFLAQREREKREAAAAQSAPNQTTHQTPPAAAQAPAETTNATEEVDEPSAFTRKPAAATSH